MASNNEHVFKLFIYHNSKVYSPYPEDSSLLGCYAMSVGKIPTFCTIQAPSSSGQRLYNLLHDILNV